MSNQQANRKTHIQGCHTRGIDRAVRRLLALRRLERTVSSARLLVFALGATLLLFAWGLGNLPLWIGTGLAVMIFLALVVQHQRLRRLITAFESWINIKRAHVARMTLDWAALPPAKSLTPVRDDHPFAVDLDIVGAQSIHRLLDTTCTRSASERLRAWLLATAPDVDMTCVRAALVRELIPLSGFRDRLARVGSTGRGHNGDALLDWLRSDESEAPRLSVIALLAVWGVFNLALLWIGETAAVISVAVYLFISNLFWRRMGDLFGDALLIQAQVQALRATFDTLETHYVGDRPSLRALIAPFTDSTSKPSASLRRIGWIAGASSLQRNFFLWLPVNSIMPYDLIVGYLLAREKRVLQERLPRWLNVWYELEALNALANFAHLHPHYTFPVIDAAAAQPFVAVGIGHPLIDEAVKVRNDYAINALGAVTIITGSNMAGKSSFLRALGVNLALASAGGVCDAHELCVIPLRLFTCIRVSDSVVDGFSYFYAEVRRLKALIDALHESDDAPLFFLIDEIFRGTNNRERLIGARAFTRALTGARGVGLIATHDLELVRLADELPQISNYHFREQVIDGQLAFDYTLRPGASPTTNALVIMRLAGLPVEEAAG